jgi:multiple sugar transport system permease protein
MKRQSNFAYRMGGYLFALPFLLLFAAFVLGPLVYGFILSFIKWEMITQLPPSFVGLANYREAFDDQYFWKALKITALFVLFCVPLTVGFALAAATGLAALRSRVWLYRAAFILPTMLNITVVCVLWQWFYNGEFGFFNHYLNEWFGFKIPWIDDPQWALASVVLMTVWWTLGTPAIILMAGIQQIPLAHYEAAAVDGAGPWQRFRHITLPGIRPVLLFVVIMNIIASFQVFGQTFILTKGGPELSTRVLVHYIYDLAFNFYRMGFAAAVSWILFFVIVVFAIIEFRFMRER